MAAAKKAQDEVAPRKVIVIRKGYDGFAIRKEGTVLIWKKAGPLPSWLELYEDSKEEIPKARGGRGSSPAADTVEDEDAASDRPDVVI